MDYQKQANDFAQKHGIVLLTGKSEYKKHFAEDTQCRYVFNMRLKRNGETYKLKFGQSINEGNTPPDMYSVLASITKQDVGSFEDFCSDFGYDTDSRSAEKTYKAVCKEYGYVKLLFNDLLEDEEFLNIS